MMPYRDVGWISLMLVDERWRRCRLATRLMAACIEALEGKGLVPALDATPVGREVYVQMGFRDVLPLTRWLAAAPVVSGSTVGNVRPMMSADLPSALALDLPCFGGGRRRLFERLLQRAAAFACVAESAGNVIGFLLGRDGRSATHLGPVFAPDLPTAAALVEYALAHQPGPAILDIPDGRIDWADWLRERGFGQVRPILRMVRSERPPTLGGERLYAVAGPDLG
jgi:ribosomal protein S18 acetylase RimI-like enzyme